MSFHFKTAQEWFEALDRQEMKHNVKLYERKLRHENNPDMKYPPCDFELTPDNFGIHHLEETKPKLIEFLEQNHAIRVAIIVSKECYFLLSTYEEDPEYFAKCDNFMYDHVAFVLYFMIRFPKMDETTYFILSGMSEYDSVKCTIDFPAIPAGRFYSNEPDKLRFYREYMDGIDLTPLIDQMRKMNELAGIKTFRMCAFSSNEWKILSGLSEKFNVPTSVIQYIHEGKW